MVSIFTRVVLEFVLPMIRAVGKQEQTNGAAYVWGDRHLQVHISIV